MRKALFGMALAALASSAMAQPSGGYEGSNREAYRKGYDDGYQRGFDKGLEEGRRNAPPVIIEAPPPGKPGPTGPITVSSAVYGNGSKSCSAMRFVAPRANGRSTATIDVSNSMCGDPAPGGRKELEVAYICGSYAKSASGYEHRSVFLDCTTP
jgi:hypothetical protein